MLTFDEKTRRQLNMQLDLPDEEKAKEAAIELPWRQWLEENRTMDAKDADKASAVVVLHNIHEHFNLLAQKVDVKQSNESLFVVASADARREALR